MIIDDEVEQRQDLGVIELFDPEYDPEANTLKYDITAVNATTTTSINLPGEFGQSTLVIDDDGCPQCLIPIAIFGLIPGGYLQHALYMERW